MISISNTDIPGGAEGGILNDCPVDLAIVG